MHSDYGLGATYLGGSPLRIPRLGPLDWPGRGPYSFSRRANCALEKVSRGYQLGVLQGLSREPDIFIVSMGTLNVLIPPPSSSPKVSMVHPRSIDPQIVWEELHWSGIPLSHYVLLELHVGTFTAQGTFGAIVPHLDELKDLGITAFELMPVAQFPGSATGAMMAFTLLRCKILMEV